MVPVPNFGVPDWWLMILSLGMLMCVWWLYVALEHGYIGTVIAAYAVARDCAEMKTQYTGLGMGIMCTRHRRSDRWYLCMRMVTETYSPTPHYPEMADSAGVCETDTR